MAGGGGCCVDEGGGSSSPLTAKGDLYTFTTVPARLPVGLADGQILIVDSTTPTGLRWVTGSLVVDPNAWHKTGDAFGATEKFGTLDNYDVQFYTNNAPRGAWLKTGELIVGATALTVHPGDQETLLVKKDWSGSSHIRIENYDTTAAGAAEATFVAAVEGNKGLALFAMGPNAADIAGYGALDAVVSTYGDARRLVYRAVGDGSAYHMWIKADNTEAMRTTAEGRLLINTTSSVATEYLRVNGRYYGDDSMQLAGTKRIGLGVDPLFALHIRDDVADITTGILVDNRDASGQPFFAMGPNPRGTNDAFQVVYDNATSSTIMTSGDGDMSINAISGALTLKGGNVDNISFGASAITVRRSAYPSVDNTYQLGDATHRFTTLYSAALNTGDIHFDDEQMDSHLTLREAKEYGEDPDAFYLINRRTYPFRKFKLQLVAA